MKITADTNLKIELKPTVNLQISEQLQPISINQSINIKPYIF